MTCPLWLADALDRHLRDGDIDPIEHDAIVQSVLHALPRQAIADTIARSAAAVLAQRGIRDAAGDFARELGNNAAAQVEMLLQGMFDEEAT